MKYFKKIKKPKKSKNQLPVIHHNNTPQKMISDSEINAGEITDNKSPIEDMIILSKLFGGE
jgi:hypothetical protein